MANAINTDKQATVIGALAEGSSIRSIERMTGIHRDKIMRFGVRVGQGCAPVLDAKLHFAHYNLESGTAAAIERHFWSVGDLVEAAT